MFLEDTATHRIALEQRRRDYPQSWLPPRRHVNESSLAARLAKAEAQVHDDMLLISKFSTANAVIAKERDDLKAALEAATKAKDVPVAAVEPLAV